MANLYLAIAIVTEVIATAAMKAAEGFTRPLPSAIVVVGYGISFYFMSLCLRTMDVGIVYAIWCGVGVVLITIIAAITYKQFPDGWALVGMALIIGGVCVLYLLSKCTVH
jgi:small multidrug resistance pump